MSEKYLLIGGSRDGEWIQLREPTYQVEFRVSEPPKITDPISEFAEYKTERYFLETMASQTTKYFMYRHESLDTDDVLQMLMQKYVAKKQESVLS